MERTALITLQSSLVSEDIFFRSTTNVTVIHNFGILVIDQFLHVSHSVVQSIKVDPEVDSVMSIKHFIKSYENGKTFQV